MDDKFKTSPGILGVIAIELFFSLDFELSYTLNSSILSLEDESSQKVLFQLFIKPRVIVRIQFDEITSSSSIFSHES